jgi:hypothetical protein
MTENLKISSLTPDVISLSEHYWYACKRDKRPKLPKRASSESASSDSNSVQTNHKTGRYKACHAGSPFRPSSSHKSHNICRKPKRLSFETFKCFKHWSFRKRNKRIFASSWPVDPYSNPFACTHGTVRQYVNVHVDNSATVHKPSRYIIYFASHTFTTTYCTCRDC